MFRRIGKVMSVREKKVTLQFLSSDSMIRDLGSLRWRVGSIETVAYWTLYMLWFDKLIYIYRLGFQFFGKVALFFVYFVHCLPN